MKTQTLLSERGQTLVQVTLAMVLLLAIVALAIDVGYAYRQRRSLQNAADAGALAGAWELCFNPSSDPATVRAAAVAKAREYAITRNLAPEAVASIIADWTVRVETREQVETFIAGVIGINTVQVGAVAEAMCGQAEAACGVWPVGFEVGLWPGNDQCGQRFLLWEDGQADCTVFDCDIDDDGVDEVPLDGRTWLDFTEVLLDGAADPCDGPGCGNDELRDRIEGEDKHTHEECRSYMRIPSCAAGDSGVRNSTWNEAGGEAGEVKLIPLYDESRTPCEPDSPPDSPCGYNTGYYIVDVGCVRVNAAYTLPKIDGGGGPFPRVIEVEVACNEALCSVPCAGTNGLPPGPGDARAVSLTR